MLISHFVKALIGLGLSIPAHAAHPSQDLICLSRDKASGLALTTTPLGQRLSIHSSELSLYSKVAYGIDLGRLELVKEINGQVVIDFTPDGFHAMTYAPAANRPDLVWFLEFQNQSGQPNGAAPGTATLTDIEGHKTVIELQCSNY